MKIQVSCKGIPEHYIKMIIWPLQLGIELWTIRNFNTLGIWSTLFPFPYQMDNLSAKSFLDYKSQNPAIQDLCFLHPGIHYSLSSHPFPSAKMCNATSASYPFFNHVNRSSSSSLYVETFGEPNLLLLNVQYSKAYCKTTVVLPYLTLNFSDWRSSVGPIRIMFYDCSSTICLSCFNLFHKQIYWS